jgi:hypothetical protein
MSHPDGFACACVGRRVGGGPVFQDSSDSSLTAMSRATAGHPAMIRLMVPWSAVAMLAARLAAVPMIRAA